MVNTMLMQKTSYCTSVFQEKVEQELMAEEEAMN